MPLLWKKKKPCGGSATGGRFSRLISHFQSPSKRDGSLVVETGFPTSLIDLFVKNSDRMKNSSKRSKREKQQQGPNIDIAEAPSVSLVDDREILTSTVSVDKVVNHASLNRSHTSAKDQDEEERVLDGADPESVDQFGDLLDRDPDRLSSLFIAMLMVVILGLLAMFTKWLVMGATIAALLLGFAEFILGTPVVDSLQPCINGRAGFRCFIRNVRSFRKSKRAIKVHPSSNPGPEKSVSTGLKHVTGEIGVSVSKLNLASEAQVEDDLNPTADVVMSGEYIRNQEKVVRRIKLRSKIMKKIVPKKIMNRKTGEGYSARSRI